MITLFSVNACEVFLPYNCVVCIAVFGQWKNDEAALVQDHEEKLKQLRDEKAHVDEEYKKLLHKSKVFCCTAEGGVLSI